MTLNDRKGKNDLNNPADIQSSQKRGIEWLQRD